MEDRVDLPGLQQAELINDRGQDFGDGERSFPLGCELWIDDEAF